MADSQTYPGGLTELGFLRAYLDSTLRLPQAVADAVMRTSVLAGRVERILLAAAVAAQLGEAARRLCHVFEALDDRTFPVARTLAGPLPGIERWNAFAQLAATLPPSAVVTRLSLDESATPYAERLRALGDLAYPGAAVAAHASSNPVILVPGLDGRSASPEFLFTAADDPVGAALGGGTTETDAAGIADLVADLTFISRGLLETYLLARTGALRA